MKRLADIINYEGKSYRHLEEDIGKRHIEKVFFALVLLEKEIIKYQESDINIQVGGVVRTHGLPEALQKKIMDYLDADLWFQLQYR